MPKMKVERSTDYRLTAMIRGEMAAQNVSVEKASRYAGGCVNTLSSTPLPRTWTRRCA